MPNTTDYRFGDVVLVPFPFTESATKKRPAIVNSSEMYHRQRLDVMVVAVTSHIPRSTGGAGEVVISGWKEAGRLRPSLIKPVLATLERQLILRWLGALVESDRQALRDALKQVLG